MPLSWKPYPSDSPHTVTGDLRWVRQMIVPQLSVRRAVTIWLPPEYDTSSRHYPVVYMFDGQNLFDAHRAFGHSEWHVDETMTQLAGEGLEAIVVALDHGGERRVREYTPFAEGQGVETMHFLTQTLKPRIDASLRTLRAAPSTLIAGSSMGGLMSFYGAWMFPQVFGGAAVFSPALWPGRRAVLRLVEQTPAPPVRFYVDHGTAEPSALPLVRLLRDKGYGDGESLLYVAERGGQHNEAAWARRFPGAMRFLLGASATGAQRPGI